MTQPGRLDDLEPEAAVRVERLNNGQPVIAPTENWWESGVTFNPAAYYLEPGPQNAALIRALLPGWDLDEPRLADGVVAVHYRARPEHDPESEFTRSFIGLAVFTPTMEPLYRHPEPVLLPGPEPYDKLGVEDPRVHRFGDQFVMVYCGVQPEPVNGWRASLCMAVSTDLVRWQKRGVMPGDLDRNNNKDGVLFPTPIGGKFLLLHRPFGSGWSPQEIAIRLAQGESLDGPWQDLGVLLRAYPNPAVRTSWVGAGSVPISLGDGRYLHIFHTGNTLSAEERLYTLDAALLEMNRFDPEQPGTVVASRLQPLMVPETPAELRSESSLQVSNVLFACGSFLYQGWVNIVYGGADTYTLAARVRLDSLLRALEATGDVNPYQG